MSLIAVVLGLFIHDALATTPNAGLWYIPGTVSYVLFDMAHSTLKSVRISLSLAGGIISVAVIKHDRFTKTSMYCRMRYGS